jgi:hypothetical protein
MKQLKTGHRLDYGAVGGMRLAGETEMLGEGLPQFHFFHHKSHIT